MQKKMYATPELKELGALGKFTQFGTWDGIPDAMFEEEPTQGFDFLS